MNWQPIETAPKDSRDLILYFPDATLKVMICCWIEWDYGEEVDEGYADGWYHQKVGDGSDSQIYDVEPTHWMELPEPPCP